MAGVLRANPPLVDGSLHLTVANPSQTWQANRPLSLGESVRLSVTAEASGRTSPEAPVLHLQSLRVVPESLTNSIWIDAGPSSIRALHLGHYEMTFSAQIEAFWKEQQPVGTGGGGASSRELASQYGMASGTATSKNPSFSWIAIQPRHQFNDGSSRIQFLANAESNIAGVTLSGSGYTVSTSVGTLHGGSLNSAGSFAGEVSSIAAGSTRLSIAWTGQGVTKELARSRGIAFSDIDMKAKAGPGSSEVLAEDRVKPTTSPDDPASNPDGNHEMAPGTFAFLLPSSSTNVTRTEVIIGKQLSATTPARAKLESQGLPSLVVSTDVEGNATLSLPAAWPNANAIPSTIYLHGTTDAQNPPTQKGTLTLTLEVELKDDIQTAPFSNQPSTEKSWHKIVEKIGVTLLPIDIKEVASDQINDSDCNKLPTAKYAGEPNNPMFMATRSGVRAHLAIKVDSPEGLRDKVYVGARKVGATTILGSVKVNAPNDKTKLEFDALPGHEIYEVVAGYDQNGNASLDNDEAQIIFKKTPTGSATSNLERLDKMFIVTESQFGSSKFQLYAYSLAPAAYASDLIGAFGKGANTISNASTSPGISISAHEPGLSHPVGSRWNPDCTDETYRFTFADGSPASNDFEESNAFKQIVEKMAWDNLAALVADYDGSMEWQVSPPYTFNESKDLIVTESGFINRLGSAFGKVDIGGTIRFSYKKTGPNSITVGNVELIGRFDDLYDFQFNRSNELFRNAASVQAGHATLAKVPEANAGKVFFTRLEFNSGWKNWNRNYTKP